MINLGEVNGLLGKEEVDKINMQFASEARRQGVEPQHLFQENVRKQLHIVLAFSPVGSQLKDRFRRYSIYINYLKFVKLIIIFV